jgi:hypothetical protein
MMKLAYDVMDEGVSFIPWFFYGKWCKTNNY